MAGDQEREALEAKVPQRLHALSLHHLNLPALTIFRDSTSLGFLLPPTDRLTLVFLSPSLLLLLPDR